MWDPFPWTCRKRSFILLPVISSIQLTYKNNRPHLAFYKGTRLSVGSQDFKLVPIKIFAIGKHSTSQANPGYFADKWKCVWGLLSHVFKVGHFILSCLSLYSWEGAGIHTRGRKMGLP